MSDPHNVAWTFNIRGADVGHTPLPLAFATVPKEGRASVYIDGRKLSNEVRDYLETLADVREPGAFAYDLKKLGTAKAAVRLDSATAADALSRIISDAGGTVTRASDPITLIKAQKNATEIAGTRSAHQRDGAAVANFLAWFDREAPKGELTEIGAVAALETFRRDTGLLKELSFPTISGRRPERRDRALSRHPRDQPARSTPANCSCSIAAHSMKMAPPISPVPSRSARPRRRCATALPAC